MLNSGDGSKIDDDSSTNLNALRQALGTTTRCNAAKSTKNKSTSTKDSSNNSSPATNNNNVLQEKQQQQQQQRAGTPPYTTQKMTESQKAQLEAINEKLGQSKVKHIQQKISKSVEPEKSVAIGNANSLTKEDDQHQQQPKKKRLYKSVSTQEIFCAAGKKCKGHLNSKAMVALSHFNNSLLNSDELEFVKDRYQEEEDILPEQIQHFLRHVWLFDQKYNIYY